MTDIKRATMGQSVREERQVIVSRLPGRGVCRLLMGVVATLGLSMTCVAAPSTDCQLNLSDPSVDYGHLSTSTLKSGVQEGTTVSLGKRMVVLNVVCKQPAILSIVLKGQEAGADRIRFSDRGFMTVRMSGAQLDGRAVELGKIPSGLLQPSEIGLTALVGDGQGVVPVSAQRVAKGVNFTVNVEVEPAVQAQASRVRDETTWETKILFELHAEQ